MGTNVITTPGLITSSVLQMSSPESGRDEGIIMLSLSSTRTAHVALNFLPQSSFPIHRSNLAVIAHGEAAKHAAGALKRRLAVRASVAYSIASDAVEGASKETGA